MSDMSKYGVGPIGVDSLQLAKIVKEEYVRYFESEFPIRDEKLRTALHKYIRSEKSPIFRGPYIQVSQNLGEARPKESYPIDPRLLERLTFAKPYPHQGLAWERITSGNANTILTSGTGSGKTEALLVPLLNDLLKALKPGLRAILVYPMNALLNDQLLRLNGKEHGTGLLDPSWGITARDYTGSTSKEERLEIQEGKVPSIILTNYKMLELMLLRGELQSIFAKYPNSLSWLFYDELHTYIGVKGAEVAYLNRRLKAASGVKQGELKCMAASATAGEGDAAKVTLTKFAGEFFGENFDLGSVIGLQDVGNSKCPAHIDDFISERLVQVPELRQKVENRLAYAFAKPATVEQSVSRWIENDSLRKAFTGEEVRDEITKAITYLWPNGKPLPGVNLEHRVHLFLRGFIGVEHSLESVDWDFETTSGSNRPLFPLALCRECGEAGFMAKKVELEEGYARLDQNIGIDAHKEPDAVWLTPSLPDDDPNPVFIRWNDELSSYVISTDDEDGIQFHCQEVSMEGEIRVKGFTKCPFCEAVNNQGEQVRRIASGASTNITVLTASMMTHLPRERQKLITFADSRQDVALQAGFTNQRAYRLTLGAQLAEFISSQEERSLSVTFRFKDFFDDLVKRVPESIVPPKETDKRRLSAWLSIANATLRSRYIEQWANYRLDLHATSEAMKELEESFRRDLEDLLTSDYPYSMSPESNGFLCLDYIGNNGLTLGEACKSFAPKLNITEGESKVLARWLLDRARRNSLSSGIVIHKPEENGGGGRRQRYERPPISLIGKKGLPTAFSRYLSSLLGKQLPPEELEEFCNALLDGLLEFGFLTRDRQYVRIATDKLRLSTDLVLYQCSECRVRRSYPAGYFNSDTRCTMPRCKKGRLIPMDEKQRAQLFYRRLGELGGKFSPINAAEHSAWVPEERRTLIEQSFNSPQDIVGNINTIVSSPTLEMGVDLKRTPAVIMRNVPPLVSSYKQRAGRAGRDTKSALVVTHTRPSPYDRFYYENPERMIDGHIHLLTMPIENELIVSRHVHSYLLWSEDGKLVETLKSWRKLFFDDLETEECDILNKEANPSRMQDLLAIPLASSAANKIGQLYQVFNRTDRALITSAAEKTGDSLRYVLEMKWLPQLKELQREYRTAYEEGVNGKAEAERRAKQLRGMLFKHLGYRKTREGTKISKWAPVFFLADVGFLPRYEFPGETLTLRCMPNRTEEAFEAQEDLFRALYDYAPGRNRQIWALGHKYSPHFFRSSSEELETRFICETHGFIGATSEQKCSSCLGGKAYPILSPSRIDADTDSGIDDSADDRSSRGAVTKHFLSATDPHSKNKSVPLSDALPEEFRFSACGTSALLYKKKEITITRIVGSGFDKGQIKGFGWCAYCANLRKIPKKANKDADTGHRKDCLEHTQGTREKPDVLLFGQKSNVSVIEIRLPRLDETVLEGRSEEEAYQSLLQALLHQGKQICELGPRGEGLSGDILNDGAPFLIIYDPVPGGAGTVPILWREANKWFSDAYHRVADCDCSAACDRCLLDYTNQRYHANLSRRLATLLLGHLRQSSTDYWSSPVINEDVSTAALGSDPVLWDTNSALERFFATTATQVFGVKGSQLRSQVPAIPNTVTPDYKATSSGRYLFLDSKLHHFENWGDVVSDCSKRNQMSNSGMEWAPVTNRMVRSDWVLVANVLGWCKVEYKDSFSTKAKIAVPPAALNPITLTPTGKSKLTDWLDSRGRDISNGEMPLGFLVTKAKLFGDISRGDGTLLVSDPQEAKGRVVLRYIVEGKGDFDRYCKETLAYIMEGYTVYLVPISTDDSARLEMILNETVSRD